MQVDRIFDGVVAGLPQLDGKVFAVTGCTTGTGYHCCVAAIRRGAAVVVLLNRPSARATAALEKLRAIAGFTSTSIIHVDCDLQTFASVRKAAAEVAAIAAVRGGLDGLVNNAGVMALPDVRTVDGYDVQMQTNHLSHFLLSRLLMPSLELAAARRGEARVVQHSSGARRKTSGDGRLAARYFEPAVPGALGGSTLGPCFKRYHQTKLANSVFAMALHRRLRGVNAAVKSICAEPGVAVTALVGNLTDGHAQAGLAVPANMEPEKMFPGAQSAADGACPLIEAAFGTGAGCGDFYMPGDVVQRTVVGIPVKCVTAGHPTPTSPHMAKTFDHEALTMDVTVHDLLWRVSEAAVGKWDVGAPKARL